MPHPLFCVFPDVFLLFCCCEYVATVRWMEIRGVLWVRLYTVGVHRRCILVVGVCFSERQLLEVLLCCISTYWVCSCCMQFWRRYTYFFCVLGRLHYILCRIMIFPWASHVLLFSLFLVCVEWTLDCNGRYWLCSSWCCKYILQIIVNPGCSHASNGLVTVLGVCVCR